MRELLQSVFRFSWSMSLLGLKQFINMFSSENRAGSTTQGSAFAGASWSPMPAGTPAAKPAESRGVDPPNPSTPGQVNSGWSPMPA